MEGFEAVRRVEGVRCNSEDIPLDHVTITDCGLLDPPQRDRPPSSPKEPAGGVELKLGEGGQ